MKLLKNGNSSYLRIPKDVMDRNGWNQATEFDYNILNGSIEFFVRPTNYEPGEPMDVRILTEPEKRVLNIMNNLGFVKIQLPVLFNHFRGGYSRKQGQTVLQKALDGLCAKGYISEIYLTQPYVEITEDYRK